MKLKKIEITNFRGIDQVTLDLEDQVNLFVGINGAGKSTILDGIAISLSWLINRIQRENSSGKPITLPNIKNDKDFALISTVLLEGENVYNWKIARAQSGTPSVEKSELTEVSSLASYYMRQRRENDVLPVIAYYPINRVVGNVTADVSGRESISILDVYDNALGGQTNYQAFFEWFRLQDDIVNERANSRTKWISSNKSWIKRRTNKLLANIDKLIPGMDEDQRYFKERFQNRFKKDELIYEDPRFLFHELSDMFRFVVFRNHNNKEYNKIYEDIDYMLHRMSTLSDSRRDDLIEFNGYPSKIVWQVIDHLKHLKRSKSFEESELPVVSFIWDTLLFSVLLSLWWMSDKGKKALENLFSENSPVKQKDEHFEENTDAFVHDLDNLIRDDVERFTNASRNQGRELHWVTQTIENFVEGYSDLRVKRVPRPHLLVDKFGLPMNMDQLSDGEKNLIAMVGDIARRLSIANPNSRNPLNGKGIILIDEIDLHLHPGWQRLMIPKLTELFPNCQFIISTHSPQVISHTHPKSIFILKVDKNQISFSKASESYGMNTDRILEDLLGVDARPRKEKQMIHTIFQQIQRGEVTAAQATIEELIKSIGDDPELLRAQTLIKRKTLIGK